MKEVAVGDGSEGVANKKVVSYARFLEVRQRRQRVVAEFRRPSSGHPVPAGRPSPPLTVDGEPLRDKRSGIGPDVENQ